MISGTEVTLTAQFNGDIVGSYEWKIAGGSTLTDGDDYEIPSVVWQSSTNSLTSTLKIKSVSTSGTYECKGTYTAKSTEVTVQHAITVLGGFLFNIHYT